MQHRHHPSCHSAPSTGLTTTDDQAPIDGKDQPSDLLKFAKAFMRDDLDGNFPRVVDRGESNSRSATAGHRGRTLLGSMPMSK
jgi:hypothetical protein